jgi:hypothetical protein
VKKEKRGGWGRMKGELGVSVFEKRKEFKERNSVGVVIE